MNYDINFIVILKLIIMIVIGSWVFIGMSFAYCALNEKYELWAAKQECKQNLIAKTCTNNFKEEPK